MLWNCITSLSSYRYFLLFYSQDYLSLMKNISPFINISVKEKTCKKGILMKYQSILLLFLSAHTILESYDFVYEKKFTHETSNNQSKTQPTQDYWEAEARQSFFYEKKC